MLNEDQKCEFVPAVTEILRQFIDKYYRDKAFPFGDFIQIFLAPSLVYLRLLLNVDLKQYKEEIMNAVTEEIDRIAVLEIPEGFAAQALYNLVGPPGTLQ